MPDSEKTRCAELIALQARLLLFNEGPAGVLTIRREADGRRRVEVEYEGAEKFSARGGLVQIGQSLEPIATQFHRLT